MYGSVALTVLPALLPVPQVRDEINTGALFAYLKFSLDGQLLLAVAEGRIYLLDSFEGTVKQKVGDWEAVCKQAVVHLCRAHSWRVWLGWHKSCHGMAASTENGELQGNHGAECWGVELATHAGDCGLCAAAPAYIMYADAGQRAPKPAPACNRAHHPPSDLPFRNIAFLPPADCRPGRGRGRPSVGGVPHT